MLVEKNIMLSLGLPTLTHRNKEQDFSSSVEVHLKADKVLQCIVFLISWSCSSFQNASY